MTDAQKQEFTRKISNANKSDLVVILYDMFDCYAMDAVNEYDEEKIDDMVLSVRKAKDVVRELINTLNPEYEISSNLYSIYRYVEKQLITAEIRRNSATINEAAKCMRSLAGSFREIAKQDTDEAIMKNAETVYVGMTYGKNSINESSGNIGSNRGFFA